MHSLLAYVPSEELKQILDVFKEYKIVYRTKLNSDKYCVLFKDKIIIEPPEFVWAIRNKKGYKVYDYRNNELEGFIKEIEKRCK